MNRTTNQLGLAPMRIPKIRPSWIEAPPSITSESRGELRDRGRGVLRACACRVPCRARRRRLGGPCGWLSRMAARRATGAPARSALHAGPPDRAVAALARAQHGVVARDQLVGAGLSRHAIAHRTQPGSAGRWLRGREGRRRALRTTAACEGKRVGGGGGGSTCNASPARAPIARRAAPTGSACGARARSSRASRWAGFRPPLPARRDRERHVPRCHALTPAACGARRSPPRRRPPGSVP